MNTVHTAPPVASRGYQPLVVVLLAACGGIVLDEQSPLAAGWWWMAALVAWICWWALWRRDRLHASTLALLLSIACTAAAWHHCRWALFAGDEIGRYARAETQPAALEAIATGGVRRVPAPPPNPLAILPTGDRTRLEVRLTGIRDRDHWQPVSGQATVLVNGHLLGVEPGDRIQLFCQLGAIEPPANPGEFDFAAHARRERRLCSIHCEFPDCVTRVAVGSRLGIERIIDALRSGGDALLWRSLGPRRSGLAAAMFLGAREELEPEQSQTFLETGTIHLLVVSGLNVGILAGCLFFVMRWALIPRGWALALVATACVLYAAATDAQPPVVRATVMVLIACLAMVLGRQPLGYNTLAAAGLVVLAINPAELFQSGTQLSFLSVAVLAWAAERRPRAPVDPLERLIAATRPWYVRVARRLGRNVARAVWVSIVIWLVIAPLVMARFHLVSPVAIVLGPLLAIPVGVAMASGFGIFALGWLAPPLADALGWVCDGSLYAMEGTVAGARNWPGSYFWVAGPANWWLSGLYLMLGLWLLAPGWRPPTRWCVAMLAGWVAVGFSLALLRPRDTDNLNCTFLSVGHGAAVVVELPGGQTLLYDAGRLGSPTRAGRAVSGFLWSRGITHLDAVVISHADADHYNALPALLEQFSVGVVYVSPVMFLEPSRALDALGSAIETSGVPLRTTYGGDRLRTSGTADVEVLHPPRRGVLGSDNANSIVLAIEWAGRRVLLTGDLESPGMDDLLAEEPYDCDVVLAPHHGSAFSDPPQFAAWSTPQWAIVSGGQQDRLDVMAGAYEAQGARVLHTAVAGAVQVRIEPESMAVDAWQADE